MIPAQARHYVDPVVAWLSSATRRRLAYGVAIMLALVLCVVPRQYVARVKILPQSGNSGVSALIGALGGGAQNFATLLGGAQTNYLVIGRSHDVVTNVIDRLHLIGRPGYHDRDQTELKLIHKVDIEILTGGILEITAKDSNPAFARELAAGFMSAVRDRLTDLGREQTAQKKATMVIKLGQANLQLVDAEQALSKFRSANQLASPQIEFGAATSRKLSLEAQLQAKQVELQTARQFAAGDNIRLKTIQYDIASLSAEIAKMATPDKNGDSTVTKLADKSAIYLGLFRNVQFAESLVDVYKRFFEEISIEELSNSTNIQIIEEPYVDPARQFNPRGVGLLLLLIILAFYTEYYIPLTGLGGRRPSMLPQ